MQLDIGLERYGYVTSRFVDPMMSLFFVVLCFPFLFLYFAFI